MNIITSYNNLIYRKIKDEKYRSIMKKLMNALGYDKFYVQGGDWGAIVASNMATLYPDRLVNAEFYLA